MNVQKENISLWQLFILILLFHLGSAIVVNIGEEARNSAWISIIIACFAGLFLLAVYFRVLYWFPGKNLFEILEICLGKWLGKMIGILYITYFFLIASFVLRDFGELMVSTIFTRTPLEFIHITMMLLILYILMLGIEVLGRISEIFIPYALIFLLFLGVGIALSGELNIENIFPIFGDGITHVLKPVFPELMLFPFGEFIAFMVIIPYVSNIQYAVKTGVSAYLLSGIVLSYSSFLQITTLGALKDRSNFPLLSAAREISLLNFIERVDLLIVFIMMLGIIVKVSVFFYGGIKGLESVFQIPYRDFAFPMAMVITLSSIMIGENYPTYINMGIKVIPKYLHTVFQILIPALLLALAFFNKSRRTSNNEATIET